MSKSIQHQFFFSHPPEIVWEYLTKTALMELWLMKSDFQPIVGHEFQFRTSPVPSLHFDGIFHCRVLEIVPFKKLSYSWKWGPGEDNNLTDSIVRWQLEAKDNGTELLLVHSGFSDTTNLNMYAALSDGWLENLHKIAKRLKEAHHGTTNT